MWALAMGRRVVFASTTVPLRNTMHRERALLGEMGGLSTRKDLVSMPVNPLQGSMEGYALGSGAFEVFCQKDPGGVGGSASHGNKPMDTTCSTLNVPWEAGEQSHATAQHFPRLA